MIDLLIYHVHVVAAIYAFTARWQRDGFKGGFLAVATCALVFTILWAMTGPIARIIMPQSPQPGDLFTTDTLSLTLLLIPEAIFFRAFFLRANDVGERDAGTSTVSV